MAFVPNNRRWFEPKHYSPKAGWVTNEISIYRLDASRFLDWLVYSFGFNKSEYNLARSNDCYFFHTPDRLSAAQIEEIEDLREIYTLPVRQVSSPDVFDHISLDEQIRSSKTYDNTTSEQAKPSAPSSRLPSLEYLQGTASCVRQPGSANALAKTWTLQPEEADQSGDRGPNDGIYQQRVNGGESSDVYACIAQEISEPIFRSTTKASWPRSQEVMKVAIKRLKPNRSSDQNFEREHNALIEVKKRPHPNLIDLIVSFDHTRIVEGHEVIEHNFMFPRAIGNLKQLFRGDFSIAEYAKQDLWFQLPALADALDHIHTVMRLVHADLKPSNILLFPGTSGDSIVTKIADFGLAADLEQLTTWQLGTFEKQSAIRYDPPELRMRQSSTPTRDEVCKGDIWKLGCVFAELITFLVQSVKGVKAFRIFRTTSGPNFTSDAFDDGTRVKPEVRDWLDRLAASDGSAAEIMTIVHDMLNLGQDRPLSGEVKSRFEVTSLCLYSDGLRTLRFTRHPYRPEGGVADNFKYLIERSLHQPVCWWPFEEPRRLLPAGHVRVSWDYAGTDLQVDVKQGIGEEYRRNCIPVFSQTAREPTMPPPAFLGTVPPTAGQSTAAPTASQHARRRTTAVSPGQSVISNAGVARTKSPSPLLGEEVYMCVDRSWVQPEETLFRGVVHKDITDNILGVELLSLYHELRGWKGRLFSWKNCFDIEFIEFACTAPNENRIAQLTEHGRNELPQSKQDWTYTLIRLPDEMHCKLTAKEIVRSMHHPKQTHNKRHIWPLLPRKQMYPLRKDPGESGWGIRAKQGWSNFRFLVWMVALMMLGLLFMALWLALVDKKDMQTATLGAMFIPTFLAVVLGYAQNKTKI